MKKPLVFIVGIIIGVLGTLATLYVLKLFPQEVQGYLLKPYYYPQLEYNLKPKTGSYTQFGTYTQSGGTYVPVDPEL